jgi:hypothetical protein
VYSVKRILLVEQAGLIYTYLLSKHVTK